MEHFWDTPWWSRKTISRVTYIIQVGQFEQARDDHVTLELILSRRM